MLLYITVAHDCNIYHRNFDDALAIRYNVHKAAYRLYLAKHEVLIMPTEWLSADTIAEELGVNVATVRAWIRRKRLKAVRIGRDYRIKKTDYGAFLEEHSTISDDSGGKEKDN